MNANSGKIVLRAPAFLLLIVVACMLPAIPAAAQMTSVGIDCSQIPALHIMRQDNMRAAVVLMECGIIPKTGDADTGDGITGDAPQPPNILVSTRVCSTGDCTKSESMVWHSSRPGDHTIVVTYNEAPYLGQYSGTSYSTDDGATFTEILPPPFSTGHGLNYGDPIVVFNRKLDTWFAGDLVTGCGGFGIGLWTSHDGQIWTPGACAHNGGGDDRESMWVDNNPSSRYYGRMYISWDDGDLQSGDLAVTHSDDGITWSTPVQLITGFIRNVQITGTPTGLLPTSPTYGSTVFVAGMDEGSGGLSSRQNIIARSLDGGVTWTTTVTGPRFNAVGDATCHFNAYFAIVNPIWRHMGWGEPAVGPNGVVHYVYAGKGQANGDNGDIYYVRSTDNGETWSAPIKLNDDAGGQYKTQWMPSLSLFDDVTGTHQQAAKLTVSWYDRRHATSACSVVSDPGCSYERYGVQSADNGNTWGANFPISTQLINQPAAPSVNPCYAGDYDYSTALEGNAFVTWTDGRINMGGVQVQNVEFASVPEP